MTAVEQLPGPHVCDQVSGRQRLLIYGMNYSPEPTGVGRYTGEIGSYLVRQGVDVDVVTAVPHYPGWTIRGGYQNRYMTEMIDGARISRCPLLVREEMRGIWRVLSPFTFALTSAPVFIWRLLTKRPNIVLCIEPTLFAAPLALILGKLIRARTVLHVQDLEVDAAFSVGHVRGKSLQNAATSVERLILRSFDSIITISNRMRQHICSKGVSRQATAVVRNWVNLDKIGPLTRPSSFREELGLDDSAVVAMYAGNIGQKQALPVIFTAAEQLISEKRIIFVIAGDGPEKRKLLARYGHLSNVKFLPVQPEERLCELLNLADIHLLPQDPGVADLVLPSKLAGMLATGKPCVVMADPGTELFEFLGDGAVIIPPGDATRLHAVLKLALMQRCKFQLGCNDARLVQLAANHALYAIAKIVLSGEIKEQADFQGSS